MNLFRYKGVLAVRGMKKKFVFQGVHMIFSGQFSDDNEWKDGEERTCKFVFIGRNLDKAALIKGFEDCAVEEQLRFKAGDKVQANVGEWVAGFVVELWSDGNPYKIELTEGRTKGARVFAPMDEDDFVRVPREKGG
mmetsp:Transcript_29650/g.74567  ORF Transcript_29650/g.74567 Transcript_29650/m.74567 type:complete len:136 (-) Transcript_29650:14-421(-)